MCVPTQGTTCSSIGCPSWSAGRLQQQQHHHHTDALGDTAVSPLDRASTMHRRNMCAHSYVHACTVCVHSWRWATQFTRASQSRGGREADLPYLVPTANERPNTTGMQLHMPGYLFTALNCKAGRIGRAQESQERGDSPNGEHRVW